MIVPLSWLQDYVDITLPVPELAERMTLAGLEVETIQYIGVSGADLVWDRDKFVVARILAVGQHPDADRLVLARVEYGAPEPATLVTGATNLFPYLGQDLSGQNLKSPMVLEGAAIYDGHKEGFVKTRLKGRKVRGIMNRHMLCSEKELGISQEHEGIMLLETAAVPGTPLQDILGEVILHLDLTPNLARCHSMIGVAREVAALTGTSPQGTPQTVRYPSLNVVMGGPPAAEAVRVEIEDSALSPRFTATLIRDVRIGLSPEWMQRRLKLVGVRPINNIVDITNYVMMELGQPLHAFDYDLLLQRARTTSVSVPTIKVRQASIGEGMTTLDGTSRTFNEYDILITDTAGPVGIGGVMGGTETEVHVGTRNVLLEAANFNLINIRRTAQAHKLPSEASARFGRGIHPAEAIRGARRAAELMRTLAGGTVGQGIVDNYPDPPEPVVATVTPAQIKRWLGIHIDQKEVVAILEALQFQCQIKGGAIHATVPDHRLDISTGLTGTADLIEEISRIYGYGKIPETEMSDPLPPLRANRPQEQEERTRDLLVAAGLQEIISYRFTTPEAEARILSPGSQPDERPYTTIANPISQDKSVMRHTLLESLLVAVAANVRHHGHVALFEIGSVYLPAEGRRLPDEPTRLCVGMAGQRETVGWMGGDEGSMDFYDLKGVLEALTDGWRLEGVRYEPTTDPVFCPGRAARVSLHNGRTHLGTAGQVHPLVAKRFDMPDGIPLLAAELDLDALMAAIPAGFEVQPIPQFPVVYRDVALVLDEAIPAADVQQLIVQTGGRWLAQVRLFDVYRGTQLPAGKRSLAYALAFQSPDKTLTDRDANKLRDKIVRRLEREIGARLRSQ
ncbi:MAG: phenylalanine--tRNA ligase subunit beta [Ardenticatenales bacterium]|nr:phenylalanine--tRNA ligase subunit beta [Ardenticatenales bacterium]